MTETECPTLHFPAACPDCEKVSSMPTRVSTLPSGGVLIKLKCRDCDHEWECTLTAKSTGMLQPKVDRRQT